MFSFFHPLAGSLTSAAIAAQPGSHAAVPTGRLEGVPSGQSDTTLPAKDERGRV
jgi:hypothetical protein